MKTALELVKNHLGMTDITSEEKQWLNAYIAEATADLESDDISDSRLATDLGQTTIALIALDLINGKSPYDNNSITAMRVRLSSQSRGDSV